MALWCLPGAIGMLALALGIARVGEVLPRPVYALLSGLNAATVGIIALAGVQLAEKAITDRTTRILVFLGATAGMLYTALWYFPVIMVVGGITTWVWDSGILQRAWKRIRGSKKDEEAPEENVDEHAIVQLRQMAPAPEVLASTPSLDEPQKAYLRRGTSSSTEQQQALHASSPVASRHEDEASGTSRPVPEMRLAPFSIKTAIGVIIFFAISLITIMVLRARLSNPTRPFSLFANLFLAGTIIFGGGPVVIPLLREYVVEEGWVSERDFLLGLALIQAWPGPNFNFAVYLGALSLRGTGTSMVVGAIVGFIAIFSPGLILITGIQGVWRNLRNRRWLKSILRGLNATAVGLIFTAVYRLWQIGLVDSEYRGGRPLATDPWWVVITATSFMGCRYFGFDTFLAIVLGGVLGLIWYAVVRA